MSVNLGLKDTLDMAYVKAFDAKMNMSDNIIEARDQVVNARKNTKFLNSEKQRMNAINFWIVEYERAYEEICNAKNIIDAYINVYHKYNGNLLIDTSIQIAHDVGSNMAIVEYYTAREPVIRQKLFEMLTI
jgi:hypothetical protein